MREPSNTKRTLNLVVMSMLMLTLVACGGQPAVPKAVITAPSSVTVPFDQARTVTFALAADAEAGTVVDVALGALAGFDVSPATFQLTEATPSVTVNILETLSTAGAHELTYTAAVVGCTCAPASGAVTVNSGAIVTSLTDSLIDLQPGELRYYLGSARAQSISFAPELITAGNATINLTGTLQIIRNVSIIGPAHEGTGPLVRLVGTSSFNIVTIEGGATVNLENLHLENGLGNLGGAVFTGAGTDVNMTGVWLEGNHAQQQGGAVYNGATMTIEASRIFGNTASDGGGGVWNAGTLTLIASSVQGNEALVAGGIGTTGQLSLTSSKIEDNIATASGGGLYAPVIGETTLVEISDTDIERNQASQNGAGIYMLRGILTITGGSVSENHGSNLGSGIFISRFSSSITPTLELNGVRVAGNSGFSAAGIYSQANATIRTSVIEANVASGPTGGIGNNWKMTIEEGTVVRQNEAGTYAGGVFNTGVLVVSNSFVEDNTAGDYGAGLVHGSASTELLTDGTEVSAQIISSGFRNNSAVGNGGGIYSVKQLRILASEISGNTAEGSGGGIYSISRPHSSAPNNNGGTLLITATTVSGNTAFGSGGGIYSNTDYSLGWVVLPNSPVTILNSTIASNNGATGGGLYLAGQNAAPARLFFNTIAINHADTAPGLGGGVHVDTGRTDVQIQANLIVGNQANAGGASTDMVAGPGQVVSGGNNFISLAPLNVSAQASDRVGTVEAAPGQVQLGALDYNGGGTTTMAITATSSAATWILDTDCVRPDGAPLVTDQRSENRPVNGTCSVGAYQVQ